MQWIALHPPWPPEITAFTTDAQRRQALGWLALRFSPRVALVEEAVLLEVSTTLRLFGGLAGLRERLASDARALGAPDAQLLWQARGASALVALARLRAARLEPGLLRVAPPGLPLHTLSAARPHLELLERIGCRSWGDLLRLPRDGVARRFGQPLLDALDRARGRLPENEWPWLTLPEVFEEQIELPAHVESAEGLMPALRQLLAGLQAWLLGRQSGVCAARLVWQLDRRRETPPSQELVLRTATAVQNTAHLERLAAEHLAHITLPAPAQTLTLRSLEVEPLADAAAASGELLLQGARRGDNLIQFVERLSARLGPGQVLGWRARADNRPECMQTWDSATGPGGVATLVQRGVAPPRHRRRGAKEPPFREALYPSWLLAQPLRLVSRDERPFYEGTLTLLVGPQRLESSGWAAGMTGLACEPALRDYFIASSPGAGLLWIYREHPATADPHWYLHGIFA